MDAMKAIMLAAVFLTMAALGATAQAKLAPVEHVRLDATVSADAVAMTSEPLGATLESNYFNAPAAPIASGRVFPCRLQIRMFDKTRLAQSCH